MDDRSKFESKLAQLGQLHENLGIPKQYLEVMGPIFCQIIRPVLMAAAAMPNTLNTTVTSPTDTSTTSSLVTSSAMNPSIDIMRTTSGATTPSFWSRDSKSAWIRFFRIIAFQMKRGYIGATQTNEVDNQATGVIRQDSSKSNVETDSSAGQVSNLPSSASTDNSQYLLLHHPSTTSEGSHKTKKRLARQKMLAISGFTSGFAKSFDVASGCPITGQNISGVTGSSTTPYVISDSHAQRKAMFLKQYYHQPNRRVSIDESSGYVR